MLRTNPKRLALGFFKRDGEWRCHIFYFTEKVEGQAIEEMPVNEAFKVAAHIMGDEKVKPHKITFVFFHVELNQVRGGPADLLFKELLEQFPIKLGSDEEKKIIRIHVRSEDIDNNQYLLDFLKSRYQDPYHANQKAMRNLAKWRENPPDECTENLEKNDLENLKHCLIFGKEKEEKFRDRYTKLAENKNFPYLFALLNEGIKIGLKDKEGEACHEQYQKLLEDIAYTALIETIDSDDISYSSREFIEWLRKYADETTYLMRSFHYTVRNNRTIAAQFLLETYPMLQEKINEPNRYTTYTKQKLPVLHQTKRNLKNLDLIRLLLNYGADPKQKVKIDDKQFDSPLEFARKKGWEEKIKILEASHDHDDHLQIAQRKLRGAIAGRDFDRFIELLDIYILRKDAAFDKMIGIFCKQAIKIVIANNDIETFEKLGNWVGQNSEHSQVDEQDFIKIDKLRMNYAKKIKKERKIKEKQGKEKGKEKVKKEKEEEKPLNPAFNELLKKVHKDKHPALRKALAPLSQNYRLEELADVFNTLVDQVVDPLNKNTGLNKHRHLWWDTLFFKTKTHSWQVVTEALRRDAEQKLLASVANLPADAAKKTLSDALTNPTTKNLFAYHRYNSILPDALRMETSSVRKIKAKIYEIEHPPKPKHK